MPRLRLLDDLITASGSGIDGASVDGEPVFNVPPGQMVPVRLDATGWAGADSITGSEWDSSDGIVISSRVLSGKVASCNAYVPEPAQPWAGRGYRVRNTLTLDTGVTRKTTLWLRAERRWD